MYIASNSAVKLGENEIELDQATEYPWEGKVQLTVTPQKPAHFALKLRIPGWAENEPVTGSDLYTFTSQEADKYTVSVNGKAVKSKAYEGYIAIDRQWNAGDVVELTLPMDVRRVKAHEKVKADEGLLAIERGPVVYCLEGVDMPDKHVFNKYIPDNNSFSYKYVEDKLNGIVELEGTAKELDRNADGTVGEKRCSGQIDPLFNLE